MKKHYKSVMSPDCGAFKELEIVHEYLFGKDEDIKPLLYLKYQNTFLKHMDAHEYNELVDFLTQDEQYHWQDTLQSIDDIYKTIREDEKELREMLQGPL